MKYLNDYLILITIDLIEMPNLSSIAQIGTSLKGFNMGIRKVIDFSNILPRGRYAIYYKALAT